MILGIISWIILWGIAGLTMWGAVATGQYFFKQGETYKESSPSTKLGYEVGGVLIPLLFIAPFSLVFFVAGISAVGGDIATSD